MEFNWTEDAGIIFVFLKIMILAKRESGMYLNTYYFVHLLFSTNLPLSLIYIYIHT